MKYVMTSESILSGEKIETLFDQIEQKLRYLLFEESFINIFFQLNF